MQDITTADPRAKAQLDLLSHLIGSRDSAKGKQIEFHLSLFNDNADDDDESAGCVLVHFLCDSLTVCFMVSYVHLLLPILGRTALL